MKNLLILSLFSLFTINAGPQEDLWQATEAGDIVAVEAALKAGANINKQDSDGLTALMRAARRGHVEVVAHLVGKDAEVAKQDAQGQAALTWAAAKGHAHIVKLLINGGAELDQPDRFGKPVLVRITMEGHANIVNLLINGGAKISDSLKDNKLVIDAVRDLEKVSKEFFDFIKAKKITSSKHKKFLMNQGYEILGKYARPTQSMVVDKIRQLKKQGYKVTALRDKNGDNVLHKIAWHLSPDSDVAKLFVYYYPALMNKPNNKGVTPFQLAIGAGPAMTKIFVDGMSAMPKAWKDKLWNSLSRQERKQAEVLKAILLNKKVSDAPKTILAD